MMQVMNVPSLKDHMQLWSEDEPPKSEPMEPQTPQKDLRSNKKTTEDSSPLDQSSNPDSGEESKQSPDEEQNERQSKITEDASTKEVNKEIKHDEKEDYSHLEEHDEDKDEDEKEEETPLAKKPTLRSAKIKVIPATDGSQSSETCDNEDVGKPLDGSVVNIHTIPEDINDASLENQASRSGQSGGDRVEADSPPSTWVANLIQRDDLFKGCPSHCRKHLQPDKTTLLNYYCINCESVSCQRCMEQARNYHENHQVLKIRRSSYHNVIRLSDLIPVVDTLYLQNYVINQAKVVFIKERPHNNSQGRLEQFLDECRRKKTSFTLEDISECFNDDSGRIFCWNCERNLQTSTARFCSLGCKFQCNQLLGEKLVSLQVSGDARRDGLQQVSMVKQEFHSRNNYNGFYKSADRRKRCSDSSISNRPNRRKGIPCKSPVF